MAVVPWPPSTWGTSQPHGKCSPPPSPARLCGVHCRLWSLRLALLLANSTFGKLLQGGLAPAPSPVVTCPTPDPLTLRRGCSVVGQHRLGQDDMGSSVQVGSWCDGRHVFRQCLEPGEVGRFVKVVKVVVKPRAQKGADDTRKDKQAAPSSEVDPVLPRSLP